MLPLHSVLPEVGDDVGVKGSIASIDKLQKTAKNVGACVVLFLFTVSATIFADLSKNPNGEYPYDTFMIPTIVEIMKFIVSACFLLKMKAYGEPLVMHYTVKSFFKYSIPGLLYFMSNNCVFYIIKDLGPSQFQILKNLNVFSTAILMRFVLNRHLTWLQWKALILLVIGAVLTQLMDAPDTMKGTVRGYFVVFIYSVSSAAAGVHVEKALKEGGDGNCIHWQNLQLYFFGVVFGLISVWFRGINLNKTSGNLDGFNYFAYATVLSLTLCGLSISVILKYLDNIAKCFVGSLSMLFVTLHESLHRAKPFSTHYFLAIVLVFLALEQYNIPQ